MLLSLPDVSPDVFNWTNSVPVDSRMVDETLWGSMGHVAMLGVQEVIPVPAATAILGHLLKLQDEHAAGNWTWIKDQDDVQMTVERKLIDALGMDVGGRMHTSRSRNDQVRGGKGSRVFVVKLNFMLLCCHTGSVGHQAVHAQEDFGVARESGGLRGSVPRKGKRWSLFAR